MVFKKKRTFRRKRKQPVVKRLAQDMRILKSTEETKQAVVPVSPAAALACAQNGTFLLVTNIPQGNTKVTRVGNKCSIIGMNIKGSVANGSITGPAMARLIILVDRQSNGVIPTNAQLMADTTAATNWNSPINIDNRRRFRILVDKTWACNDGGGATNQAILQNFRFRKVFKKPIIMQFSASTSPSAITDFVANPFIAVAYTDAAAGAPFFAMTVELLYKDA